MFEAYEELQAEKDAAAVTFPVYLTNKRGEMYKLMSRTVLISIRHDDVVKGIGYSDGLSAMTFSTLMQLDRCTKEDFEQLHTAIIKLISK